MKQNVQNQTSNKNWAMASVSSLVLSVACVGFMPSLAMAQDVDDDASDYEGVNSPVSDDVEVEDPVEDTIIVTGQRQALESAADLKRASDTIGDSIVLDEANKIPSTSLLEVLERAPGVTMNRIRAGAEGSPDGFAFEGSGVQVRGLSKTKTLINGREVFSANGGSGLSWADVGPELLKAVTVYKASRADLIEGGVGGTIDLQTHMPFDFDGFKFNASVSGSYGDFAEEITPAISGMISDRWETPLGEIGILADVAYSKIASYDSNIIIPPYYPTEFEGRRVYAPGGVRYTEDQFERVREGFYGAVQWQPIEQLEFFHTTFISRRETERDSQILAMEPDGAPVGVFPGAEFDGDIFTRGRIGGQDLTQGIAVGMNSSFTPGFSKTSDFSQGFAYDGDRWGLSGSYQYVEAESRSGKYSLGLAQLPQVIQTAVDLEADLPYFEFIDPLSTDPSTAGLSRINWLNSENQGKSHAFQLDADFDISDEGFFRKVAVGGRIADREESDNFVGTWWSPTGRGWNGVTRSFVGPTVATFEDAPDATIPGAPDGDFYLEEFENFFKGEVDPLGSVWLPTSQVNSADQFARVYDDYLACGPDLRLRCNYNPNNENYDATTYLYADGDLLRNPNFDQLPQRYTTNADTKSAYAMLGYANESDSPFLNFSGNVGVRWVNYKVRSQGNFTYSSETQFFATAEDQQAAVDALGGIEALADIENQDEIPNLVQSVPFEGQLDGGFEKDYFLPSFNIKFEPAEDVIFRYALTQTLTPPRYPDIRAQGTLATQTTESDLNREIAAYYTSNGDEGQDGNDDDTSIPNVFGGYTSVSGDPTLEPEIALNHDVSLEWYPRRGTAVTLSLFHKTIDDYVTFNNSPIPASVLFNGDLRPLSAPLDDEGEPIESEAVFLDGSVSERRNLNASEDTIIRGAELGARTYFDMLPGLFSGFGIDANVTYIDNEAPDAFALDVNGNELNVPVIGLSKWAYSATALYDYEKLSARLSYNWRDRYLTTTNDSGTTRLVTDIFDPNGSQYQIGLPVYAASLGRLDGSLTYSLNDNMTIAFNVQNILDAEQRTEMELLDDEFVDRAVFITDRRFSVDLGFNF